MAKSMFAVVRLPLLAGFLLGAHTIAAAQNACGCSDGKVCGTGAPGNPFRCCNLAADTCNALQVNNPCKPLRCSVEPTCCVYYFESCLSDAECGGRPGSCDLSQGLCTEPCDPSILPRCGGNSKTCQPFGGPSYQVPNGTACDDKRSCSRSIPPGAVVACVAPIGGGNCARDRALSDGVDDNGDCPASAPMCSGSDSAFGGQGGAVVAGRCCPQGTACDLNTNTCRGNFGTGVTNFDGSFDACQGGDCTPTDYSTCIATSAEAGIEASLRASRGIGTSVDIVWTPACNATDHTVFWGTSPIAGLLNWTGAACALGVSGSSSFDPGTPGTGALRYFVVVGRIPGSPTMAEGSYGRSSAGGERPKSSLGTCQLPRLIYICP